MIVSHVLIVTCNNSLHLWSNSFMSNIDLDQLSIMSQLLRITFDNSTHDYLQSFIFNVILPTSGKVTHFFEIILNSLTEI